jgi:hypothetical protein
VITVVAGIGTLVALSGLRRQPDMAAMSEGEIPAVSEEPWVPEYAKDSPTV